MTGIGLFYESPQKLLSPPPRVNMAMYHPSYMRLPWAFKSLFLYQSYISWLVRTDIIQASVAISCTLYIWSCRLSEILYQHCYYYCTLLSWKISYDITDTKHEEWTSRWSWLLPSYRKSVIDTHIFCIMFSPAQVHGSTIINSLLHGLIVRLPN